jgi:purine-binding chemotaxis protein CheW
MKRPRADWQEIHRRLERSRQALQGIDADDRARQEEILRQRAGALAKAVEPTSALANPADCVEVLVFEVAGERYAFDSTLVGEVLRMVPLTPLPGVPDHVVGIVALRGDVLPVLDLRSLLNLPLARLAEPAAIIVLRSADMQFGVLAEAVVGVARYSLNTLQSAIPGLARNDHDWLQGIAPDRTAVFDAAALLADPRLIVETD